jgi:hypothetical protein
MKNYKDDKSYNRLSRRNWQKKWGEIPKDRYGVRCHIHHLDHDHTNNGVDNLIALEPKTHRRVHNMSNSTILLTMEEVRHIRNNTTPDYIYNNTFQDLVDLLVLTMRQIGAELTSNNGGRDGWEDIVEFPDDSIDEDGEYDSVVDKAHHFIFKVAYPVALMEMDKRG